jgi:hypothetical protein
MWEGRGRTEEDPDQKASEDARRRLEEVEIELRLEEERRQQEKARMRAEELKKQNQAPGGPDAKKADEVVRQSYGVSPDADLPAHAEASQLYLDSLLLAYRDGKLSRDEVDMLELLRQRLGLTDREHHRLLVKAQLSVYSQAMIDVWQGGVATQDDFDRLDELREQLNISADDHLRLERLVRRQSVKRDPPDQRQ